MANEDGFGVVAWRRRENTPARLRAWLAKVLDAPDLAITNFRSPTDNGASSQTFLISAGYTAGGNSRTHEIVVRQEPAEDPPFMDPRFGVWANAQAAIAARSTIVAPKVLGVELDPDVLGSPFSQWNA
ncbi:MAG: hypothetical protein HC869_01055 [Rhodospirillales bacterium]|nr:hypothetical protein [Rhodospirillales bacterium]